MALGLKIGLQLRQHAGDDGEMAEEQSGGLMAQAGKGSGQSRLCRSGCLFRGTMAGQETVQNGYGRIRAGATPLSRYRANDGRRQGRLIMSFANRGNEFLDTPRQPRCKSVN